MSEQFMFYRNFYDSVPKSLRKEFCYALAAYVFDEELPEDEIVRMMVNLVAPSLNKSEMKRGGNNNPSGKNQHSVKAEVKAEVKDEVKAEVKDEVKSGQTGQSFKTKTETETETDTKSKTETPSAGALSFRTPTVDEVKAYCFERDHGVSASAFVDFYEAKGWKIGKNPMKDWRAAVRTWEKRDNDGASVPRQPEAASSPTDYDGRFAWIEELKRSTTHA